MIISILYTYILIMSLIVSIVFAFVISFSEIDTKLKLSRGFLEVLRCSLFMIALIHVVVCIVIISII
jgi:hypothetical protein